MKKAIVTIGGTRIELDLTRRVPACPLSTWDFSELSADGFWNHPCAREIRDDIIRMAVEKHYGRRCWWLRNSGMSWHHGQVFEAIRATKRNGDPGSSGVTSMVRLTLTIDGVEV